MKFEELKKSLQSNIANNYLLYGNDAFVLQYAEQMIVSACNIQFPEMNDMRFGEDFDMQMVLKALDTVPMMSDKKVVRVDISDPKRNCQDLVKYLDSPNPTSVLIVNIHDQKDNYKTLVSAMNSVDCNKLSEKLVSAFLTRELKKYNKSITASALQKLVQYCLLDMSTCMNEAKKVALIIGDRTTIEDADIENNVTKNMEYQIFELTENLAKKDGKKVYQLLNVIKQKKDNVRSLNSLIFNHFRRMLHVGLSKMNKSQLATYLGVKEYAITKTMEQAKLFTKEQLKDIFEQCLALDYQLKNSEITPENAIDFICLYILNLA